MLKITIVFTKLIWRVVLWPLGGINNHTVVIIPRITLGSYQTYVNICII